MGVFTTSSIGAAVGSKIAAATYWTNQVKALIDGFGANTAYTPTLGGTGWALGNGTIAGSYTQIGKQVTFRVTITWGTTSTFGSSNLTVSLPVNSAALCPGDNTAIDTSASARYGGSALIQTSSIIPLFTPAAAGGPDRGAISTVPFTWASTDILYVAGQYEAA